MLGAAALAVAPGTAAAQTPSMPLPDTPIAAPSRTHGATVARIVATTRARRSLGSRRTIAVRPETSWSQQAQTLLVLRSAEHGGRMWLRVLLASRPNGSTAWVPRDHVELSRVRHWVVISTGKRRVTVYHRGKRVRGFRAVVGARRTPTPRTLAAIYERNRQPNPKAFLGPWSLALTAVSNVYENYGGGPGRVAVHGRAGASLRDPLGSARSHGCVRIANRDVRYMARTLPPGTPVRITR